MMEQVPVGWFGGRRLLALGLLVAVALGCAGWVQAQTEAQAVFRDAKIVWHLGNNRSSGQNDVALTTNGDVRLGAVLPPEELAESLGRGGDGQVAEFRGGYLATDSTAAVQLEGNQMTLALRVRDPSGAWAGPLFGRMVPNGGAGSLLYPCKLNRRLIGYPQADRLTGDRGLEYLWQTSPLESRTRPDYFQGGGMPSLLQWHIAWEAKWAPERQGDFVSGKLRLTAPLDLIGDTDWHDIVVRFRRTKLELFVDGVLLDEDWPHGDLSGLVGPFLLGAGFEGHSPVTGFQGQMDHLALWDRALSDTEVAAVSGGIELMRRREVEILGARPVVGQYWRPWGVNTFVGDCMAFAHEGVFHVFYLADRRHGGSKWGLQALPWGHLSTRDFKNWEEHPCPLDITEPWECCLGTGALMHHDGKFHLIYIKHDRRAWFLENPNLGDAIFRATSEDGIHFHKETTPLLVPGWFGENDINPGLYANRTTGGYLLSLCNWKVLDSADLQEFAPRAKLTVPVWWPCTSYWEWNGHYYFTSCGRQWRATRPIEDPRTEWRSSEVQSLNDGIRVPQVASFGERQIMVGFTPEPAGTYYGGELLVRELIQHSDGSLGTKWLPEMIPPTGSAVAPDFLAIAGNAQRTGDDVVRLESEAGMAIAAFVGLPRNARIRMRIEAVAGVKRFGLGVRGEGNYTRCCELQLDPNNQRVQFGLGSEGKPGIGGEQWVSIEGVSGLAQPLELDLIVKDDLVDACLDGRRTIITRNRQELNGDRLFLFVEQGEVNFKGVEIRPLSHQ